MRGPAAVSAWQTLFGQITSTLEMPFDAKLVGIAIVDAHDCRCIAAVLDGDHKARHRRWLTSSGLGAAIREVAEQDVERHQHEGLAAGERKEQVARLHLAGVVGQA